MRREKTLALSRLSFEVSSVSSASGVAFFVRTILDASTEVATFAGNARMHLDPPIDMDNVINI